MKKVKKAFGVNWTKVGADWRPVIITDYTCALLKFHSTDVEGIRGRMSEDPAMRESVLAELGS